jgi:hypothetical protein
VTKSKGEMMEDVNSLFKQFRVKGVSQHCNSLVLIFDSGHELEISASYDDLDRCSSLDIEMYFTKRECVMGYFL